VFLCRFFLFCFCSFVSCLLLGLTKGVAAALVGRRCGHRSQWGTEEASVSQVRSVEVNRQTEVSCLKIAV
jgi:hypothetical protein